MKNNLPDVYAKTAKFLTGSSYLCAKLTGKFTIDRYLAEDFAPLYNLTNDTVDEEHCGLYCRPDQLAQVCNATDIAGTVTAKAAAQTGLAEGTPVLVARAIPAQRPSPRVCSAPAISWCRWAPAAILCI